LCSSKRIRRIHALFFILFTMFFHSQRKQLRTSLYVVLIAIIVLIVLLVLVPKEKLGFFLPRLTSSTLDQDGDGMRDTFERAYTDPISSTALSSSGDEDDDSFINLSECRNGMNPTVYDFDSDSDGMPDSFELKYSSSSTALTATGDLDGGGSYNLQEFLNGRKPNYALDDGSAVDECDGLN